MIGRVQAALALAAALGLHIGAFALHPGPAGAVASGAGGAALVSLAASDGALADLVAAWDRPPEPSPAVAPLGLPATAETAPDPMAAMQPEAPPRLPAFPELAALPPASPAPRAEPPPDMPPSPQPSAEAPAPPPPADIRPKARPKPATRTEAQPEAPRHKNPPAPAQAGQLARGTGDGAAAGQGGRASAGTASAAAAASAKAEWGARIRSRIERRKAYPPTARGAAGTVTVRLSVDPGGGLLSVNLAKSSGNDALDAAALRAVRAAAPFPAAPRGLGAKAQSFTLPMTFRR